ncbi:uncharacterized protein LOC110859717 [Folsomia candida]|uniref:Uncharacterized protein n=1 Tax=Folsomia candida TaxID=158441 RepID=A0A226DA48_FOLCA|nr:uncharacterized protein LOC110859717 [Folsomia candida]OXA42089.1 hypothetical protein Fcan01_23292 [Folsomia candida]
MVVNPQTFVVDPTVLFRPAITPKCDNRQNKCDSTPCGNLERAECILNKYGTHCKCISLITSTYCNTVNTSCSLPYVNQEDIQHFREICQNLGQGYFAETCRRNGECRCDNTSPVCESRVYDTPVGIQVPEYWGST